MLQRVMQLEAPWRHLREQVFMSTNAHEKCAYLDKLRDARRFRSKEFSRMAVKHRCCFTTLLSDFVDN